MLPTQKQYVQWFEDKNLRSARWLSQSDYPPPSRIVLVDDKTTADEAYRLACEGTSLLWRGDFHNARQLLQAINRRIDRTNERSEQRKIKKTATQSSANKSVNAKEIPNLFHQQRQLQAQRSRILSRLLLELDADYVSKLRRAPDVSAACTAAFGQLDKGVVKSCVLSFRDL